MKKLILLIVAVFFCFTSTIIAQELEQSATVDTIQNTSVINKTENSTSINDLKEGNQNLPELQDSEETKSTIIPSQGFSINSLWRGILGMITLIFVAFLFSSNRKTINWKIVGIGC